MFIEAELLPIEVVHCGIETFDHFCLCDIDLDPMTFICAHLVTRGHFGSRDNDGGHTIRSVLTVTLTSTR